MYTDVLCLLETSHFLTKFQLITGLYIITPILTDFSDMPQCHNSFSIRPVIKTTDSGHFCNISLSSLHTVTLPLELHIKWNLPVASDSKRNWVTSQNLAWNSNSKQQQVLLGRKSSPLTSFYFKPLPGMRNLLFSELHSGYCSHNYCSREY